MTSFIIRLTAPRYSSVEEHSAHGRKPIYKEMDSHLYRNVHDEKPFKKKWIFNQTEMCMKILSPSGIA